MNILVDVRPYEPELQRLRTIEGVRVTCVESSEEKRALPSDIVAGQQILFCSEPPTNLVEMTELRLVQVCSAGYTQLIGKGLGERGIRACNATGVFDVPIAEWNIAMMVNLARDLRQMIRNQECGVWDRSAVFQREIRGLTVGLWGYGGIGRETARLAKAMGLRVHVLSRSGVKPRHDSYCVAGTGDPEGTLPDAVFSPRETLEFLAGLDFLILAMPLTAATTGLLGERELRALPRTAFILNPARGPIIQEAALLRALREGWIAGTALDTHYYYPMPPEHPLWSMPNVIMTPHISGSSLSPQFLPRAWDLFVQNVQRWTDGRPLLNELSAAQLAGG